MFQQVFMLFGGLVLMIKGGDWFVAASIRIAHFLRIPHVVVGTTLVSLATTLPELVVSIFAGAKNESGLALGNAVGSCICNIGLILGISAMIKKMTISLSSILVPMVIMLSLGFLVLFLSYDLRLEPWKGWLLLILGILYFAFDFVRHFKNRKPSDIQEARIIEHQNQDGPPWVQSSGGALLQFLAGAIAVILGSKLLVDGAVSLASQLGVPSLLVGLTIVAIGTSLPELITAITSARKQVSDLSLGNVLGANIANLTLIIGTASILSEVTMTRWEQLFNFPSMLLMMGLLFFLIRFSGKLSKMEGAIFLTLYVTYLTILITQK